MKRLVIAGLLLASGAAQAESLRVAVAASFASTLRQLVVQLDLGDVQLILGATGKLATEIEFGAPYDVWIAAETQRPLSLEARGSVSACRVFAQGVLVVWSPRQADGMAGWAQAGNLRVAIAEPRIAPYGRAAQTALERAGLWTGLQPRLVRGKNAAQALQFAVTGHAQAAFVAKAQALALGQGHFWVVPDDLYEPIQHSLCLVGVGSAAGAVFQQRLLGREAQVILQTQGYHRTDDG